MRPLLAVLAILICPGFARAQFMQFASLSRMNSRLAGHIVDYSHNHGADRRIFSPILDMPRDMYVYLPPGYSSAKAYPLILYFHLAYIDEHIFIGSDWLEQLDAMIASGEFPPVVVACPDGTMEGRNRTRAAHSMYINNIRGRYQDHIVCEVMPFLMRTYSIRTERDAHAVIGISAGGFGALSLALKHRELFGAVGTLAAPTNLRYDNIDHRYRQDFDPATYQWKTEYNPREKVGFFRFGLKREPAKKYLRPVFGDDDQVEERIMQDNPADLLFSTNLKPGELAIYLNYGTRDNWNFDAQSESFVWLARQKGIDVTVERDPGGRHSLRYFRRNQVPMFRWLACHLLPPIDAVQPH